MAFAPIFQRPFSATFDRRAAAAAAASWWLSGGAPTPVIVYEPVGAASLAASYTNLVNPGTYNAAPGIAPDFNAATGWTGTGTQWLSTGYLLTAGHVAIVQFTNATTSNALLVGHFNINQRFEIGPIIGITNVGYGYGDQSRVNKTPELTSGVLALSPTAGYRNGTSEQALTGSWVGTAAFALTIMARRRGDLGGGVDSIWSGSVQRFVLYSSATDGATWIPAVSAAMAAL